jgi:ketosteroid isomerase-like protein
MKQCFPFFCSRSTSVALTFTCFLLFAGLAMISLAITQNERSESDVVRATSERCRTLFNEGKIEPLMSMIATEAELVDDSGTAHRGSVAIRELFAEFFSLFPGTELTTEIDEIRVLGSTAIENGSRVMTLSDGQVRSSFRYQAIWTKSEASWKLVSLQDWPDQDDEEEALTDQLELLTWLVGDWINEGNDGRVQIHFDWSEEKNFLIGEYVFKPINQPARKSTQRIGWDAAAGRIRSWLFESDGGFSEAFWTLTSDGAILKSNSTNPDGETASATLVITKSDEQRFKIFGKDRIVGSQVEPDFEIDVVRRLLPTTKQ